jgi:hypothetical protein
MAAYDNDNYLFREFIVPNFYETYPITNLTVTVEAFQYDIQI